MDNVKAISIPDGKDLQRSKTIGFSLLYALTQIAGLFGYLDYTPDTNTSEFVGLAISVVIIILRLLTSEPINVPAKLKR